MLARIFAIALLALAVPSFAQIVGGSPLQPFTPDEHTLLLYHFDEGQGAIAHDASGHGYDGEVRNAVWDKGRFGGGLQFNGVDSSVYRRMTEAIVGLKQFTIECWYRQDDQSGRQFLFGKDVTFHFDLSDGQWTSVSLYNKGGAEKNAEGLPHRQIGAQLGASRPGKWNHNAICYDGKSVSFFFNGVLISRQPAPKDFSIGTNSRGLWIGCYIGTDFWFNGAIDEVRISDCIRYDPEQKLAQGGKVFDMPGIQRAAKAVRTPAKTGLAKLNMTLTKLYGSNASGWVYLKPRDKKSSIVGQYEMKGLKDGETQKLELDVSDEVQGDGTYILGLEPTDNGAYFEVTNAALSAGEKTLGTWSGHAKSRRTFQPPVLVPLQVGKPTAGVGQASHLPGSIILSPAAVDRLWGDIDADTDDAGGPPRLTGNGYAEWWFDVPARSAYRVNLKYASGGHRPCDIVIDGDDLNDYNMCARNATGSARAKDAFWEYQGTTTLQAGLHWIRIQDVPPDIYGLRLEPVASAPARKVPLTRCPVPAPTFLAAPGQWQVAPGVGKATAGPDTSELAFSATFAKTDPADLDARDVVRFTRKVNCDLEPYGRLRFRFEGDETGHVVALRLVDAKGDEKLLWRLRDTKKGPQDISIPVSFEGNDVFDPAHVTAVCFDLDEGNTQADKVNAFTGRMTNPVFDRRDVIVLPKDADAALDAAREQMTATEKRLAAKAPALVAPAFAPWVKPVVPEEHPLYATTEPKPVTRATMGYQLHTTGSRDVSASSLDEFHKFYNFGDVCWPHIGICPQRRDYRSDEDWHKALQDMEIRLKDVHDRGLYLFDIWGYVPNGEAGPTPRVTPEHQEILTRVFGDKFLGYDDGEQDGRYIGSYADRGTFTDRRGGWDDFVKWDKGICDDSMNYMDATGSLNFSHYYGERGCRMLGLETAQGLPSDTLMFSFLRGAAKQYGRLTTQATSIWNRFGYNMYQDRKTDGGDGYGFGPHKGCSLSLHGRLFFCSYTGGDSICGSETSQFTADQLPNGAPELSPLGKQHLDIANWAREHPDRGALCTPVAFMLDFYNGWNMPRHLYRGDKYKIWGKLPYEKGDYLIDGMFRMIWPGYEDASYLRNERGFLCPTPYGDIFDVLTNRCHPDILKQYAAIMLLGDVEMNPEVVRNLTAYVEAGGDLILDAKRAAAFPEALTGVTVGADGMKGRMSRLLSSDKTFTELPYTYAKLSTGAAQALLVSETGDPLITVNTAGKGRVIVGAADFWMTDKLTYQVPDLVNMEPPYLLLNGVKAALAGYFGTFSPVSVSPRGLTVRTCLYESDPKKMLVGLLNNDLFADWKGTVTVRKGAIASATDLWSGKKLTAAESIPVSIAAGDVAMVEVRLR
jgi:hypothetical protein